MKKKQRTQAQLKTSLLNAAKRYVESFIGKCRPYSNEAINFISTPMPGGVKDFLVSIRMEALALGLWEKKTKRKAKKRQRITKA